MSGRRNEHGALTEGQAAFVLLLRFLATYALFLVYPFFRGIWISMHDWNLLAVAFNPDAKEFVGSRNYERVMWGRDITWGAFASPALQALGLVGLVLTFFLRRMGRVSKVTAIATGIAAVLLVLPQPDPVGDGGHADLADHFLSASGIDRQYHREL